MKKHQQKQYNIDSLEKKALGQVPTSQYILVQRGKSKHWEREGREGDSLPQTAGFANLNSHFISK